MNFFVAVHRSRSSLGCLLLAALIRIHPAAAVCRGADIDTTMLVMIGAWIFLLIIRETALFGRRVEDDQHAVPRGAAPVIRAYFRILALRIFVLAIVAFRTDLPALTMLDRPHQARQSDPRDLSGSRYRGT